jgi:hypothetical protein
MAIRSPLLTGGACQTGTAPEAVIKMPTGSSVAAPDCIAKAALVTDAAARKPRLILMPGPF